MPEKQIEHSVGQALSDLSVEELSDRILLLQLEIKRLNEALQQKELHLKEAASLFKG